MKRPYRKKNKILILPVLVLRVLTKFLLIISDKYDGDICWKPLFLWQIFYRIRTFLLSINIGHKANWIDWYLRQEAIRK